MLFRSYTSSDLFLQSTLLRPVLSLQQTHSTVVSLFEMSYELLFASGLILLFTSSLQPIIFCWSHVDMAYLMCVYSLLTYNIIISVSNTIEIQYCVCTYYIIMCVSTWCATTYISLRFDGEIIGDYTTSYLRIVCMIMWVYYESADIVRKNDICFMFVDTPTL